MTLSPVSSSQSGNTYSSLFSEFHERFGKPQVYAVLLLLAFLGQCCWFAAYTPLSALELVTISPTHAALDPASFAGTVRSPLVFWVAALPTHLGSPANLDTALWRVLLRFPFMVVGAALGASLWYVSRRLYANAGGYLALSLFCFSPALIIRWATVSPDVIAAWGTFGSIFTGIAVAHTLYAPREVVLWNWRRILLLGTSIGVAVSAVPATAISLPIALLFMFYLVPHRRGAAVAILAAATAIGGFIVLTVYSFSIFRVLRAFHSGGSLTWGMLNRNVLLALFDGFLLRNGPGFVVLVAATIVTYIAWRYTRFFGTTSPLLVALAFILLATFTQQNVMTFLWLALPFLIVFIAGVCADLLELRTRYTGLIVGAILAIVFSQALFSLTGLWVLAKS